MKSCLLCAEKTLVNNPLEGKEGFKKERENRLCLAKFFLSEREEEIHKLLPG